MACRVARCLPALPASLRHWYRLCLTAACPALPPGCFHEDGLSDCFDGFGGGWGRVQILRIMKDSRVGTYALVGVLLCTYAKLTLLSEMEPADVPRALVAAHTIGRWTSLPLLHFCHYLQASTTCPPPSPPHTLITTHWTAQHIADACW